MLAQVRDAVGDPVDVLLDRDHHVAEHGGAARAGHGEEVREAGDGQAERTSAGPSAHFSRSDRPPRPRRSIAEQRARHRVEAGAEHDRVERELLVADAQPGSVISSIGVLADRDEAHVRAVVGLEVAGVDAHPLRSERVVVRAQQLGELGVVDALADLARGGTRTRARSPPDRRRGRSRPSGGRTRRRRSAPRTRARAPRASRPTRSARARSRDCRPSSCAPCGGTPRSAPCGRRWPRRSSGAFQAGTLKFARALEHGQLRGLGGDHRDRLHGRGAGPDHADALAGEVDAARAARGPCGAARPRSARCQGCRGSRGTERQPVAMIRKRGGEPLAAVGRDRPAVCAPRRTPPRPRACRDGCRGAGRSDRRRARGSAGSRPGRRSARTTSTPARARATTSTSSVMLSMSQRAPGIAVPEPRPADARRLVEHEHREPGSRRRCRR